MFVWKVNTILEEFKKYLPRTYKRLITLQKFLGTKKEKNILQKEYPKLKKISIDFGIMEKARKVACFPVDVGWSDIGDWAALKDILTKPNQNLIQGNHLGIDTQGCLIFAPKEKLIATIGIKNLIIVIEDKAILVSSKASAQKVKNIVEILEKKNPKLI